MANSSPLVVDLDGTLIHSDLLIESALLWLRDLPWWQWPLMPFLILRQLLKGKAALKAYFAQAAEIDASTLPYDSDVLQAIKAARAQGQRVVLATASQQKYAQQVAAHLGFFDMVMGSDANLNLSGSKKRNALVAEFGEKNFDYIGNAPEDLKVWAAARGVFVANASSTTSQKARALAGEGQFYIVSHAPTLQQQIKRWAKGLRLHQWLKNLLIFVPLFAAHRATQSNLVVDGLVAFLCFGLCASSVYVLNDLLDLPDDRAHSHKRRRPFASGALSLQAGLLAVPVLLVAAFVLAWQLLPWQFSAVLAAYYALTVLYSFVLKRHAVIDVMTLAALYTVRIVAGTFVFGEALTFWLLAFSMFMFLSLALVKRYAELHNAHKQGQRSKTRGRGYYPEDLQMVGAMGAVSGYLAVLVLALYIQDLNTLALYQRPMLIWLACPVLLFWVSRLWLIANRGQMNEDPLVFAAKDRVSLAVGAVFMAVFWLAA